jgi:paraquat-inducible protein A
MRALLPLILYVATLAFGLGVTLPLIRIERLFVFTDEPSLIGIVVGLWTEGDWLLSVIVCLFSLVFPAVKLGLLHLAAYGGEQSPVAVPAWFKAISNWSMLDVVLVALVIFAAKTSGFATAFTQPGLWFFAASVILTAAASSIARREKAGQEAG